MLIAVLFGMLARPAVCRAHSSIVAWGVSFPSLTNVPPSLTNAIAVSAGGDHVLALNMDGTVVAWGTNTFGQTNTPVGLTNVVAIAAGYSHNLALRADGRIVAWGANGAGQTNVPAALTNVIAIAAGSYHSLALRSDGTVVVWGSNSNGQTNIPAGLSSVMAIAAGPSYCLALTAEGHVVAWGSALMSEVPQEVSNVVAVAAGGSFGLALIGNGLIQVWPGFLSPDTSITNVPNGLSNVADLAAGATHALALQSDGTVVSWGSYRSYSRPWPGVVLATNVPTGLTNVVAISANGDYSLALVGDGIPRVTSLPDLRTFYGNTIFLRPEASGAVPLSFQWQFDGVDLIGATDRVLVLTNVQLAQTRTYSLMVSNALGVVTNSGTSLEVLAVGFSTQPESQQAFAGADVAFVAKASSPSPVNYQWRFNGIALPGATNNTLQLTNVQFQQAGSYSVSASNELGVAFSVDARLNVISVAAWGGIAPPTPDLTNVVSVAGGISFGLALRDSGSVSFWGQTNVAFTGFPFDLTNALGISTKGYSCVALKVDGTVTAWGNDANGQAEVPAGLSNVVAVAAGYQHSMALKADGRVACWGISSVVSNQPPDLENVTAIAAGNGFSLALRADGSVVSWGDNYWGTNQPAGLGGVVAVAAGATHALALLTNGSVIAWGDNYNGATNVPGDLQDVVAIAAGAAHSLALKSDGTVVVWGNNSNGQTNVPLNLHNVAAIAAGEYHSCAAIGNGRPFLLTSLVSRTVVYGSSMAFYAAASGAGPLTYQWRRDGTNIIGATNAIFVLNNVDFADAARYSVVVGNSFGASSSAESVVSVIPLRFATQPQAVSTFRGDDVTLTATLDGLGPFRYQWRLNDLELNGETGSSLILSNAQTSQSGNYSVLVNNAVGSITSSSAPVSISDVAVWGDPYFDSYYGYTKIPLGLTNVIAVSGGSYHSLALKRDGTVVAWGANTYGQTNVPPGLSNVISIAAGYAHNLALLADRTVVAWPSNQFSVPPDGLSNVVAIAAGNDCSFALKADGTLVAWGYDNVGQTNLPPNLTNAVALSARHFSSLALKADGGVAAWGWDNYGQTDVPYLTDAIAVGVGTFHSAAVRADGSVVIWGDTRIVSSPVGLYGAIAVCCGDNHAMALKQDGTVFVWGSLSGGPPRLRNVVAISTGWYHNIALVGDSPPMPSVPLTHLTYGPNGFSVSVPTRNGKVYALEYKNALIETNWSALPLWPGDGQTDELIDPSPSQLSRFYRVRSW